MLNILYKDSDKRTIFLRGDIKELKLLESFLNKIPQYMFLPSFSGIPKPTVFLNKFKSTSGEIIYYCHSGLWKTIYDWCKCNNINISGIDNNFKYTDFNLSLEEFTNYVKSWKLNIEPRDYQYLAAWKILNFRQSLSQLATRAGKTLIAYMIFRYMLEHGAKKILMIVPSIQLVKQGVQDFKEYKEFFQSEQIWAKSEMCESANLTIGTYQSLVQRLDKKSKKYNPKFFNDYDVVCIDEAHHLVCKSINLILSQKFIQFNKLKFGFTGTLPEEGTIDSFACHSLMGPTIQDLTAKELIDEGFLATPIIKQYRIKYNFEDIIDDYIKCGEYLCSSYKLKDGKRILLPKEEREFTIQHVKTLPYTLSQVKNLYSKKEYAMYLIDLCKANGANLLNLEQMIAQRSMKRLKIMDDILINYNKNCIVFAHNKEYINFLETHFKEKFKHKIVCSIKGTTSIKKRQEIIDKMLNNDNVILVASYECCGTGLTFKNVDMGIFAQSFKSNIINKQSLGRLMLLNDNKKYFYLYDIIDCLPTQRLSYQGKAKIKIYKNEKYDFEIINL